jgi:hypothetical protein
MGFIWKNCRKFNAKSTDQDIRVLNDTLRELAIEYYKLWYNWSKQKYDSLVEEFKMKNDPNFKE